MTDAPKADIPKSGAPKVDSPKTEVQNPDVLTVASSPDITVPVSQGFDNYPRTTDINDSVSRFNEGSPISTAVRRDSDLIALAKEQNVSVLQSNTFSQFVQTMF